MEVYNICKISVIVRKTSQILEQKLKKNTLHGYRFECMNKNWNENSVLWNRYTECLILTRGNKMSPLRI